MFKRSPDVEYISIAAKGLSTDNSYYFNNNQLSGKTTSDGDGTVPFWSSSFGPVNKLITLTGDHIKVMSTAAFKEAFGQIFGVNLLRAPQFVDKLQISISTNKTDVKPGESLEVILIPDMRTTHIDGMLLIEKAVLTKDGKDHSLIPTGANVPIKFEGPSVASLPLAISVPESPGLYTLRFEGTHRSTVESSTTFFVLNMHAKSESTAPMQPILRIKSKRTSTKKAKTSSKKR